MPSSRLPAVKRPDTLALAGAARSVPGTSMERSSASRIRKKSKTAGFPADFGLRIGVVAVQAR